MKRLIMTGYFANICEWYDFCVFAFLLKPLSQLFGLTHQGQYQGTLTFFTLFAVSYVARPIGSIILGYLGKKYTPAKIYKYCLLFMALPSLLISFLSTYQTISSINITIIFIGLRIIQGFFTGGELPLSACYLYEEGSTKIRPLLCSFITSSPIIRIFFASVVVYILSKNLTNTQMLAYGWRIPFLVGAIIFIAIYILQRNLIKSTISISKPTKISTSLKVLLSLRGLALFLTITFLQFGFYMATK